MNESPLYAQALLESLVLVECGKVCIKLSKFEFADIDEEDEDETEEEKYVKKLIIKARDLVEKMDQIGMLDSIKERRIK